jgi:signal transduction histidine kinase
MDKYHISPTSSHEMFLGAIHRYLIWASLAAVIFAAALCFLLMKRVLDPLMQMTEITREISAGNYQVRVPIKSRDEVGQLAEAFNLMAQSLLKVEQLRKRMMIDVAHELRTPLTNIRGYLEALTDGVIEPSGETFELLQEETMRLVHLVEDILRLAKADAAGTDLKKTDVLISDLINQALDTFRTQFNAKAISVETDFGNRAATVRADPSKLSQVVANLMQNSVQYTPPGGRATISVQRERGDLKVVFSNTGAEIAPDDLPFLFERFYRGERSRSREHGGAGIGLAIVKELIEAHGGKTGAELSDGRIHIWFSLPL